LPKNKKNNALTLGSRMRTAHFYPQTIRVKQIFETMNRTENLLKNRQGMKKGETTGVSPLRAPTCCKSSRTAQAGTCSFRQPDSIRFCAL